jgi:hypothetical protein
VLILYSTVLYCILLYSSSTVLILYSTVLYCTLLYSSSTVLILSNVPTLILYLNCTHTVLTLYCTLLYSTLLTLYCTLLYSTPLILYRTGTSAGFSNLTEKDSRRIELSLYVATHALRSQISCWRLYGWSRYLRGFDRWQVCMLYVGVYAVCWCVCCMFALLPPTSPTCTPFSPAPRLHTSPTRLHSSPTRLHSSPTRLHSSPTRLHSSPIRLHRQHASLFWYSFSCAIVGHCYLRHPLKMRSHYLTTLKYFLDSDREAVALEVRISA